MSEYVKMKIQRKCKMCKDVHTIEVDTEGWEMYQSGVHIQHALPELSVDDRELLISGVCGSCFDRIFSEHDEIESIQYSNDPDEDDSDDTFDDWFDKV